MSRQLHAEISLHRKPQRASGRLWGGQMADSSDFDARRARKLASKHRRATFADIFTRPGPLADVVQPEIKKTYGR